MQTTASGAPSTPEPPEPGESQVGALGRVVLRGAAFSSAGYALEQALTIGAAIALAHLVTPEEFGIYGSATILLGYAFMFADSGLQSAVIQRRDQIHEAASTALAANLVAGLALMALAAALAPVLGLFFDDSTVTWVALAMSATVALNSLTLIPDALLQRSFSFVRRLFVSPSGALTYGVVAGVVSGLGFGVWGLVAGRYGAIVVELILLWALVRWRPQLSAMSIGMWRSLARYGRHIFAASFLTQSRLSIVTALLGRFVSIDAVGQLRYATTLVTLPRATWVVSSAYVVFPAFARIAGDAERFRAAFLRTLRWSGITNLPASAILLPLGPSMVICVLGEEWRPAGYATMALVGFPIAGALSSVISEGVKGIGRPDVLSRTAILSSVTTIVLTVAFLPLGLVGVAGATSIASLLTVVYMTRLALPVLGLDATSIARTLRPSFIATTAMVAVLFPLEWVLVQASDHGTLAGLALLLAEALVGLAVYLGVLRFLDPEAVMTLWRGARALGGRLRRLMEVIP